MSRRARLSVMRLEERENPSGPALIDPFIGSAPPPSDPPALPAPSDPIANATEIAAAIAAGAAGTGSTSPINDTNSIYNVPLLP